MKNGLKILNLLSAMSVCASLAAGTPYSEAIKTALCNVSSADRKVHVEIVFDVDSLKVKTQHTILVTPAIISADGKDTIRLEPFSIDGKTRHKAISRDNKLAGSQARPEESVYVYKKIDGNIIKYDADIDYDRRMLEGSLVLGQKVTGCAQCTESDGYYPIMDNIIPKYVPDYEVPVAMPAEESKIRVEKIRVNLNFRIDSYELEKDYMDNAAVLDGMKKKIESILADEYLELKSISVVGYASPDGPLMYNYRLSGNRAKNFANYMSSLNTGVEVSYKYAGEDWASFRKAVIENEDLPHRNELLAIIDSTDEPGDAEEQKIRALYSEGMGELTEILENIRRIECEVEYDVMKFTPEESAEMMKVSPQLLSAYEMYTVARMYGEGTEEFESVIMMTAQYCPENGQAAANAASYLIGDGKYAEAIKILEKAGQTASSLNALGVAYALEGDYERAERYLGEAARAGSEDAARNMEELTNVMNQL